MHFAIWLPALGLLLFCLLGAASAQTTAPGNPSTNPEATPNLQLTPAQKQTIYSSARNLNMKNDTPPNFQPIVGATIPSSVTLQPMSKTISELMPKTDNYEIGMVANQVVIADPKSRKVIEVIAGEKN